jgi:hypothetical protein
LLLYLKTPYLTLSIGLTCCTASFFAAMLVPRNNNEHFGTISYYPADEYSPLHRATAKLAYQGLTSFVEEGIL